MLAQVGDDAKVLAGGQSLVPILNMRLAAPGHLVDINRHRTSSPTCGRSPAASGSARSPGTPTSSADDAAFDVLPLLRQALRLVAHPAIRNRGTTVGSLAHADPAGEMTAVLALRRQRRGRPRAGPARRCRGGLLRRPAGVGAAAGRAGGRGLVPGAARPAPGRPSSRSPGGTATTRSAGWRPR